MSPQDILIWKAHYYDQCELEGSIECGNVTGEVAFSSPAEQASGPLQ